jgi:hypothetical protein
MLLLAGTSQLLGGVMFLQAAETGTQHKEAHNVKILHC